MKAQQNGQAKRREAERRKGEVRRDSEAHKQNTQGHMQRKRKKRDQIEQIDIEETIKNCTKTEQAGRV